MVQVPTAAAASALPVADSASSWGKEAGNSKPPLPLSSMSSAPLDIRSVERRGDPTASNEPEKKNRPFNLDEAPTYRPSEDEFKDMHGYIKKISAEAAKYGLCKIIPPPSWKPDLAIDTERFHFRTRKQELNSVEGGEQPRLTRLQTQLIFNRHSREPYVS